MWLKSLCRSATARELGFTRAKTPGSDDQIGWWALNQPIVTGLIRQASVTVLCDPERSTHEPGLPAVLWGWIVTSGDTVYGCGVKKSVRDVGMGRDVARELLKDRLERTQLQVIELVDLQRLALVPGDWDVDHGWWHAMRYLAQMALDRDPVSAKLVTHIVDLEREQWVPNSFGAA